MGTQQWPAGGDYFDSSGYDTETVRFFDIAHEGAQVRNLSAALEEFSRANAGGALRSVIVIPTDQLARAVAECAIELHHPHQQPVVIAEDLPPYAGVLDVVVVVGERASLDRVSQALITAGQRGCTCAFLGPDSGPLREDAPENTIVFPALPTAQGGSPARYLFGLVGILWVLNGEGELAQRRIAALADDIDEELVSLSPQRDSTVNPGRQLRQWATGGSVTKIIHTSAFDPAWESATAAGEPGPTGPAVARCAAAIWAQHGLPGTYLAAPEIPSAIQSAQRIFGDAGTGAGEDIFHDPYVDPDPHGVNFKTIIWGHQEATMPSSFAVDCAETDPQPGLRELSRAARLLTRAFAATAYDNNED